LLKLFTGTGANAVQVGLYYVKWIQSNYLLSFMTDIFFIVCENSTELLVGGMVVQLLVNQARNYWILCWNKDYSLLIFNNSSFYFKFPTFTVGVYAQVKFYCL